MTEYPDLYGQLQAAYAKYLSTNGMESVEHEAMTDFLRARERYCEASKNARSITLLVGPEVKRDGDA